MNYEYTSQISFLKCQGKLIPWHIFFTSTTYPYEQFIIGMDPTALSFDYSDLLYNQQVENFPRNESTKLYKCVKPEFMKAFLKDFMNNILEWPSEWKLSIGTVDLESYWYLQDLIDNVILLPTKMKGEDITLARAFRKNEQDKGWSD